MVANEGSSADHDPNQGNPEIHGMVCYGMACHGMPWHATVWGEGQSSIRAQAGLINVFCFHVRVVWGVFLLSFCSCFSFSVFTYKSARVALRKKNTERSKSPRWLLAGWPAGCWLAGCWLAAGGWLVAGCWLPGCWLLAAGCWLAGWQGHGCWLAGWLASGWLDGRLLASRLAG